MSGRQKVLLPRYRGEKWIRPGLPVQAQPWHAGKRQSLGKEPSGHVALATALERSVAHASWSWPKRTVYFLADPHADAEAFVASLVATGGVKKTGAGDTDFRLTRAGRKGIFVLGGDFMDKGPSSLRLLRSVRALADSGARVRMLAGNHDMRLFLGLCSLELERDPRTEHFFVRLGPKVVPLLREIHERYLSGRDALKGVPGARECRRRLYPSKGWFDEFPRLARWVMPEQTVERELVRMEKKLECFARVCADAGLSMRMVYAAACRCRELFLDAGGEFSWFFARMRLACREGSFVFIHAGIDDRVSALIEKRGIGHLNRMFRGQVRDEPFEFYYGPLGNAIRTKYRPLDMPLTRFGVARMHRLGVHAIVHGHRNRLNGQRIMLRQGMIHIEGDITMDRNTRRREGLDGYGAGATIIRPQGQVIGVSTDHPFAKVFDPQQVARTAFDGDKYS